MRATLNKGVFQLLIYHINDDLIIFYIVILLYQTGMMILDHCTTDRNQYLNLLLIFKKSMDPNVNRNSMGSRAGTAFKNNLGGAAGVGAPSRLGTAGRVF